MFVVIKANKPKHKRPDLTGNSNKNIKIFI